MGKLLACMKAFASSVSPISDSLGILTGALDKVSAIISCFPGTCEVVKLKRIIRSLNLCTLSGRLSRFFELKSGTSGLWSVSMWKLSPTR